MAKIEATRKEVNVSTGTVQKLRVLRATLLALTGPSGVDGMNEDEIYVLMDHALSSVNEVLKTITRESNKHYLITI